MVTNFQRIVGKDFCVVAPSLAPVLPPARMRYGGIERLAWLWAEGLAEARGRELAPDARIWLLAPEGSVAPAGVELVSTGPSELGFAEEGIVATLGYLRLFDVVGDLERRDLFWLDFSHAHHVGRRLSRGRVGSFIWHDPRALQPPPPQPLREVLALSQWQAKRFKDVHGYEATILDPHLIEDRYFAVGGDRVYSQYLLHRRPEMVSEVRLAFVGKMHPWKGALQAVRLCKRDGIALDVIGGPGFGDDPEYARQVQRECDGKLVVYHGELSEAAKLEVLREAFGLFYPISYPTGYGEAHSHKLVEAMAMGLFPITYDVGAMREVVLFERSKGEDRKTLDGVQRGWGALVPEGFFVATGSLGQTVARLLGGSSESLRNVAWSRWGWPYHLKRLQDTVIVMGEGRNERGKLG